MIPAKFRLTLGLVSITVSLLLAASAMGLLPDRNEAVRSGRAHLCEAIAIQSSQLVTRNEMRSLEGNLRNIVERNDDIESAAVRRSTGEVVIEIGEHVGNWDRGEGTLSDDNQVQVPLQQGASNRWGTIEIRFRPLDGDVISSLLGPWANALAFVSCGSFVLFGLFLSRVLQKMDPNGAVPQRVRTALDTLQEGLLVLDRSQKILLANNAFATLMDSTPEQLMGVDVSTFRWQEAGSDAAALPWVKAIESETPLANQTVQLHRGPNDCRTFISNCSPVLGQDGTCRGVLVSFDDVTELEHQKVQLVESKAAADAANRAKSEFLANMSHEIRTPMNAILGYTDILRRGMGKEQDRVKYLNTIHSSGQHLIELINDILDLSKIEAGRLDLELQPCSPHAVVSELVSMMSIRAEEKGIGLVYRREARLPESITTDTVRFRQCLVNLVGNAIKFTEQGQVSVFPRLVHEAGQPRLVVDIEDTGIGMDEATLSRIFNPFVQADSSITRRFGGTGLGLSISKRFAEALGGRLDVSSEKGKGSVFSIIIDPGPIDETRMIDPATATTSSEQITDNAKLVLPAARILVVDDGEENRGLIRLVLEEAGLTVDEATNGLEGLQAVAKHIYDAVFMDMQMPVMDGYTAAAKLREQGFQAPLIALTANAMHGDMQKCLDAGCSAFLPKPVDIDKLIRLLAEQLGVQAQQVPVEQSDASSSHVQVDLHDQSPIESRLPTHKPQFAAIVSKFLQRLGGQLDTLDAAFQSGDFAEVARLAHWLKGSGSNVGFDAFIEPSRELEESAKAGDAEGAAVKLQQLRSIAKRLVDPASTPVAQM